MLENTNKESRSSKRVSVLLKGNYRIEDTDFPFAVMTAVNINESGICMATDEPIADGRTIELNIILPNRDQLALVAQSVWSTNLGHTSLFRTGLKILNTQSPDFEKFQSFYQERLISPPAV